MIINTKELDELRIDLQKFNKRDLPYIQMETVNKLAFATMYAARKYVNDRFNGKSMASAIRVKQKATKKDPTAIVMVWDNSANLWKERALETLETGGDRERKSFERRLIRHGLLRHYEILIPEVKVTRGIYAKIISKLHLVSEAGYSANETRRSKSRKKDNTSYLFVRTNHIAYSRELYSVKNYHTKLAPGLYAFVNRKHSSGDRIYDKPLRLFRIGTKPNYKKSWDLQQIATDVRNKKLDTFFLEAIAKANFTRKKNGW